MAGDWMKIELELPDKPEVHGIAAITGIDPDAVVGKLVRVWQWFNKHTVDGNAHSVSFALVDRLTSVSGFGEAMALNGWLVQTDSVLTMPKFDRHTSESAKKRALTAKRVQKHQGKTNADSVSEALVNALPREEKRREDIKTKEKEEKENATATRLPADWEPSLEHLLFCKTERPDLDPRAVAASFRDYWISVPSTKGKKLDWMATWRNWVRNQRQATKSAADSKADTVAYLTGRSSYQAPFERLIEGEVING